MALEEDKDRKQVVVDAAWDDEDDEELLAYIRSKGDPYSILEEEDIIKLDPSTLKAVYANTWTIQQLLKDYQVPDTCPIQFESLFHRKIDKMTLEQALSTFTPPFFIKPATNDKTFTGFVFKGDNDDAFQHCERATTLVYVAGVVEMLNEFRLFVVNNTLFGMVESTKHVMGKPNDQNGQPPPEFVAQLLLINPYPACVIDVSLIKLPHRQDDSPKWGVVEVNPPFALSSYDWPIEQYCRFSETVWRSISTRT